MRGLGLGLTELLPTLPLRGTQSCAVLALVALIHHRRNFVSAVECGLVVLDSFAAALVVVVVVLAAAAVAAVAAGRSQTSRQRVLHAGKSM